MSSSNKVHAHSIEIYEIPTVRKNASKSFFSSWLFIILLVIVLSLILAASIILPLLLIKPSNNKPTSPSIVIGESEIKTVENSTEFIISEISSTVSSTTSTISSSISTVILTTIPSTTINDLLITNEFVTMINSTEEFSTNDSNSTIAMIESTTELFTEDNITSMTVTPTTRPTFVVPSNLLKNPGAENGSIAGWHQATSSLVIIDSNGAFNNRYLPRTGTFCFAGGTERNGAPSTLIQNVQLLGGIQGFTASQLDSNRLRAELEFYYQTWDSPFMRHDVVEVSLTFRSSSSSILQIVRSGERACKTNPGWCRYFSVHPLPFGTRSIDYTMIFTRKDFGGYKIDSYIDDNSLKII